MCFFKKKSLITATNCSHVSLADLAPGKHQMAHYAFASGIMNLGVMLPGTISGFVSDWLGYEAFFTFTLFATIPAFLITYFIPFTYADEKKQQ